MTWILINEIPLLTVMVWHKTPQVFLEIQVPSFLEPYITLSLAFVTGYIFWHN